MLYGTMIIYPRFLEAMKVRDVLRMLLNDGWSLARTRGSHRQFKPPDKPGLVTIAGSGNCDLSPATLNSILKQAGLKRRPEE
ncbi:type II toxin-antitoxin system HicA family toxin [soil metagenome]